MKPRQFTLLAVKRFFRRALVWLAWSAAVIAVLLVIFYIEEDIRGARAWADCQRELAAKGESLDLKRFFPPGKPQNDLSKASIFAPLYEATYNSTAPIRQVALDLSVSDMNHYPKTSNYIKGQLCDLAAWQGFYRTVPSAGLTDQGHTPAQDVLQVLSRFDPQLEEINTAVSNPHAYWPINYEKPFESRWSAMIRTINVAKILNVRGVAHLENGEIDLAEKDYLRTFQLNRPVASQGALIGSLVAYGVRANGESLLFEGIHRHAWNDAQLREMESALASFDSLALAVQGYRGERALGLQNADYAEQEGTALQVFYNASSSPLWVRILFWARPKGWWNLDRRAYSLGIQKMIDSFDLTHATVTPLESPPQSASVMMEVIQDVALPQSTMLLPNMDNAIFKAAQSEAYARLARIACRLEEYRIEHGQYPNAIEDLPDLPPYLNQEVLSADPLRYQRKTNGYLLYSIGWDGKDDGGILTPDPKKGDWPWPSP